DEWMIDLYDYSIFDDEYGVCAARVRARIWETAVSLLNLGIDVILDWNLWSKEKRQEMVAKVTAVDANHTLYYLNIPHSVLRKRLTERNADLPLHAHEIPLAELERFIPIFDPPTDDEDEAINVVEMYLGQDQPIHNPHLEGKAFFWEGGPVGVLLMHGLTATAAEVRLLAERLHDKGYTVAGPLLPGHGTSPEELNNTTWHDWAWEADKSYHHLATVCETVFVGGESTGAVIALDLATRFKEIAGVLCYAPAIKLALPTADLVRLYVAAPLVDAIPKKKVGGNAYWQGYRVYPVRAVMELVRLGRDVRRRLAGITQPVLVMHGRNDETIAPEATEIIMSGVASDVKENHWLEESGHVILLEDELDKIEQLTLAFLNAHLE
ncbi:MAG: alpha/beta fold hydrolase, partial [Chloroflexi bacterium]|nr:alpha/beta fold hydrolase [Chloroflexota bacterium]